MYLEAGLEKFNIQIYHEAIGEGTAVICIHGFHLDHRVMKGCLEPVFNKLLGYKRIYFDLPGMGRTAAPPGLCSSDEILASVLAFIDKILAPEEKFIVAGESYGGYLARAVINKMQNRVLAALLICPVIYAEPSRRSLPGHDVFEKESGLVDKLEFFDRTEFEANMVVQTYRVWPRFKAEVLDAMNAADIAALDAVWNKSYPLGFDADDFTSPFNGASLVICGRNDSIAGYADAFNLFKNFTHITYTVLDRCGHYLQIERPEIFNALVSDWLKRIT